MQKDIYEQFIEGIPVKLPEWKGFWKRINNQVFMVCYNGKFLGRQIEFRDTTNLFYTLENFMRDDWVVATPKNTDNTVKLYLDMKLTGALTITNTQVEDVLKRSKIDVSTYESRTTVVHVTLPNGFIITETSSSAKERMYNKEIGKEICLEKIRDKIKELYSFHLRQNDYYRR